MICKFMSACDFYNILKSFIGFQFLFSFEFYINNSTIQQFISFCSSYPKPLANSVTRSLHLQDWQTVDREAFTIRANNQRSFNSKEAIKEGSYNILLQNQPLYNSEAHTFESSHNLFRSAFSEGFPWELLEVFSGIDQFIINITQTLGRDDLTPQNVTTSAKCRKIDVKCNSL